MAFIATFALLSACVSLLSPRNRDRVRGPR